MRDFFRKKQYTIAAACVAAALLGAAGIYAFSGKGSTPEEPKEQTAQIETEEKKIETAKNTEKDTEEKKETKSASAVIKPGRNNQQEKFDWEEEEKEQLPQIAQADTEVTPEEESAEEPEETVEPMINMGRGDVEWLDDDWTVVTEDGSISAHYENTILVTDGEPEILTLL